MIVSCPNCESRYDIEPGGIPQGGTYAHCTNCENIFFLKKRKKGEKPRAAAVGAGSALSERDTGEMRIAEDNGFNPDTDSFPTGEEETAQEPESLFDEMLNEGFDEGQPPGEPMEETFASQQNGVQTFSIEDENGGVEESIADAVEEDIDEFSDGTSEVLELEAPNLLMDESLAEIEEADFERDSEDHILNFEDEESDEPQTVENEISDILQSAGLFGNGEAEPIKAERGFSSMEEAGGSESEADIFDEVKSEMDMFEEVKSEIEKTAPPETMTADLAEESEVGRIFDDIKSGAVSDDSGSPSSETEFQDEIDKLFAMADGEGDASTQAVGRGVIDSILDDSSFDTEEHEGDAINGNGGYNNPFEESLLGTDSDPVHDEVDDIFSSGGLFDDESTGANAKERGLKEGTASVPMSVQDEIDELFERNQEKGQTYIMPESAVEDVLAQADQSSKSGFDDVDIDAIFAESSQQEFSHGTEPTDTEIVNLEYTPLPGESSPMDEFAGEDIESLFSEESEVPGKKDSLAEVDSEKTEYGGGGVELSLQDEINSILSDSSSDSDSPLESPEALSELDTIIFESTKRGDSAKGQSDVDSLFDVSKENDKPEPAPAELPTSSGSGAQFNIDAIFAEAAGGGSTGSAEPEASKGVSSGEEIDIDAIFAEVKGGGSTGSAEPEASKGVSSGEEIDIDAIFAEVKGGGSTVSAEPEASKDVSSDEEIDIDAIFAEVKGGGSTVSAEPEASKDVSSDEEIDIDAIFAEVKGGGSTGSAEPEASKDVSSDEEIDIDAIFAEAQGGGSTVSAEPEASKDVSSDEEIDIDAIFAEAQGGGSTGSAEPEASKDVSSDEEIDIDAIFAEATEGIDAELTDSDTSSSVDQGGQADIDAFFAETTGEKNVIPVVADKEIDVNLGGQNDIDAMFAEAAGGETATVSEAPSGDDLGGQDDIDSMFAEAAGGETATVSEAPSGDDLGGQDDIDSMFAEMTDGEPPAVSEAPSGDDLGGQDDIDSMFAEMTDGETPAVSEAPSGDDLGGQDDIDSMFAEMTDGEPPAVSETTSSDDLGGDNDIDAMFAEAAGGETATVSETPSSDDLGGDNNLDSLFGESADNTEKGELASGGDSMNEGIDVSSDDDLDALFDGDASEPTDISTPAEPSSAEGTSKQEEDGAVISQDDLDALFSEEGGGDPGSMATADSAADGGETDSSEVDFGISGDKDLDSLFDAEAETAIIGDEPSFDATPAESAGGSSEGGIDTSMLESVSESNEPDHELEETSVVETQSVDGEQKVGKLAKAVLGEEDELDFDEPAEKKKFGLIGKLAKVAMAAMLLVAVGLGTVTYTKNQNPLAVIEQVKSKGFGGLGIGMSEILSFKGSADVEEMEKKREEGKESASSKVDESKSDDQVAEGTGEAAGDGGGDTSGDGTSVVEQKELTGVVPVPERGGTVVADKTPSPESSLPPLEEDAIETAALEPAPVKAAVTKAIPPPGERGEEFQSEVYERNTELKIGVIVPVDFNAEAVKVMTADVLITFQNTSEYDMADTKRYLYEMAVEEEIEKFFLDKFYEDTLYVQDKIIAQLNTKFKKRPEMGKIAEIDIENFKLK
ncbi:MAG: zinc-ribbon domain-containing protein [Nitrospinota bacterium]|nr:zinc-ribbon domain-containing protein [Nitrospinota bacterium]